jgi:hypothetical protein
MPDNPINPPIDPQTPPGEHRLVWRGDTPLMAETDADGVVHLYPVRRVPDACWNQPYWRLCGLPDWANNINDPVQQHLVLVTVLAGNTLEAIDKLRDINDHIEATRLLVKDGLNNLTEKRLADLLDMITAVTKTLDP